ncbi:MAG: hypothetical protein KDC49_22970 [Saprospiraceae bacterium]|nr:hypothetical protein [Saprospiraceae bacterium]
MKPYTIQILIKLAALVCILFISSGINSQCPGILKNEIDEFRNEKTALVGQDGILQHTLVGTKCKNCNSIGRLAFTRIGDTYGIRLHLYMWDVWSVSPGNLVELKLIDGQVLNYEVTNTSISERNTRNDIMPWNGLVFFKISKTDLLLFQDVGIDKIRVTMTDVMATTRVAKPEKVMQYAKCIYSL